VFQGRPETNPVGLDLMMLKEERSAVSCSFRKIRKEYGLPAQRQRLFRALYRREDKGR
jgi:hypothetical protein